MTKIITRFFESGAQARAVKHELVNRQRLSVRIVSVYDTATGLGKTLGAQGVDAGTAQAYTDRMESTGSGAVLLVRAGYKPLGVAKTTREVTAAMGAVDMGSFSEEAYVKEPVRQLSVLPDQPLMLTRMRDPDSTNYHMANWPIPLISRRKPWNATMFPRHQRMAAFPVPLLDNRKPFDEFAFPRHARMANWPIGLLVPGQKYMAKFPFGHIVPGHKFMAKFPFGHIVPRHKHYAKFPFGHIVPHKWRHMANWPFPLLINGEKHTNSLVPGHKFMAKFPFAHIVPGHKHYAKFPFAHIVPGHRFMAKFPFAHIVPGHRFMAKFPFGHIVPGHKHYAKFPIDHLVPGHKYMANWILPHTKSKANGGTA